MRLQSGTNVSSMDYKQDHSGYYELMSILDPDINWF